MGGFGIVHEAGVVTAAQIVRHVSNETPVGTLGESGRTHAHGTRRYVEFTTPSGLRWHLPVAAVEPVVMHVATSGTDRDAVIHGQIEAGGSAVSRAVHTKAWSGDWVTHWDIELRPRPVPGIEPFTVLEPLFIDRKPRG